MASKYLIEKYVDTLLPQLDEAGDYGSLNTPEEKTKLVYSAIFDLFFGEGEFSSAFIKALDTNELLFIQNNEEKFKQIFNQVLDKIQTSAKLILNEEPNE